MQKCYERINWENYPSEETPINASNLNRIDYATNELDDRVISIDTTKANNTDIVNLISNITVNDATGDITITKKNGVQQVIHTTLNKIAINFSYDYNTQTILLTLNDGTITRISLASLIQNNEFDSTDTVAFTVDASGHVSAIIPTGSITDEHLRTDYLADIRVAEANAAQSEIHADARALDSEAWAVGERDGASVDENDPTYQNNSKFYSEVASALRTDMVNIKDEANDLLETVTNRLTGLNIMINYADGCLYYDINSGIMLQIDPTTGQLMYEITT